MLAGLAGNPIGSFLNGLTPLRASVAGLFTSDILDEARNDELAGFAQFPVGLSAGPSKASSIYSAMMLDSRMRRPS